MKREPCPKVVRLRKRLFRQLRGALWYRDCRERAKRFGFMPLREVQYYTRLNDTPHTRLWVARRAPHDTWQHMRARVKVQRGRGARGGWRVFL